VAGLVRSYVVAGLVRSYVVVGLVRSYVVVGLVRSYERDSYADGNLATGRVSHARQVKGNGPDKKGYPGPPGSGSVTGRNSQLRQSYPRE